MKNARVVSGMRSTGRMHLGHLHGCLKNWGKLQYEYQCYFFVADWHALTTHYESPENLTKYNWDMVVDWLAAGINPSTATIYFQSLVPEIAELHLLLSMITPLAWLERVPTYKDQRKKLKDKDLSTYGFLGYPLLQSADVLAFRAQVVPVGDDQVAHIELIREVARRFNHLYGKDSDFIEKAEAAINKLGKKQAKIYSQMRKRYQENGEADALETAKKLLSQVHNLSFNDTERLTGYLEGMGKVILPEPEAVVTDFGKFPGLDGQKMSKSYGNTIELRDSPSVVANKIKTMPTDPARIKRIDPGNPEKCPVWSLHKVYSDEDTKKWVTQGCTTAGIGCIECKKCVSDEINKELVPIQEQIRTYEQDSQKVKHIIIQGSEKARDTVRETLKDVKTVMGLI